jgi:K+-transporting ATPase KdpF subunit
LHGAYVPYVFTLSIFDASLTLSCPSFHLPERKSCSTSSTWSWAWGSSPSCSHTHAGRRGPRAMFDLVLGAIAAAGIAGYLLYALLNPQKF